jgi:hypothetical protein
MSVTGKGVGSTGSNSPRLPLPSVDSTEKKAQPKGLKRTESSPSLLQQSKATSHESSFVAETKPKTDSVSDLSPLGKVNESDKMQRGKLSGGVSLQNLRRTKSTGSLKKTSTELKTESKLPPPESGKVSESGIKLVDVPQSLDDFEKNVRQWAAHGFVRERIDLSDKIEGKQPLVFRVFMNLPREVADNITSNGIVPGAFRKPELGSVSEQLKTAKEQFGKDFPDTGNYPELCKKANDHKNNGMDKSNLVSTTTDPNYVYGSYSGAYAGKYALAIAVIPNDKDDKVFRPETMDKTLVSTTGNHMFGMKPGEGEDSEKAKKDFESEVLFGGGVDSKNIVYAIKIELAPPNQGDQDLTTGGRKQEVSTTPSPKLVKTESTTKVSLDDLEKLQARGEELGNQIETLTKQIETAKVRERPGIMQQIKPLEAERNTVNSQLSKEGRELLESLSTRSESLSNQIETLSTQLSTAKVRERPGIMQQIKPLEAERNTVNSEASKLERLLGVTGAEGHDTKLMKVGDKVSGGDGKTYECKKVLAGGAHGTFLLHDTSGGNPVIWKPSVTSTGKGDEMMKAAETGATALANRIVGGNLVPVATELTIGGKPGTAQPYREGDGMTVVPEKLQGKQVGQMIAHMIGDWVVSNHDNNSGQFLTAKDGGDLVGFDKGQAFKHFNENGVKSRLVEKSEAQFEELKKLGLQDTENAKKELSNIEPGGLDPGYHPSGNFKEPAPKNLMESVQKGEIQVNLKDESIQRCLENCKSLTVNEVKGFLEPYAKLAFPGKEKEFYEAVVHRAKRAPEELQRLLSDTSTTTGGNQDLKTERQPIGSKQTQKSKETTGLPPNVLDRPGRELGGIGARLEGAIDRAELNQVVNREGGDQMRRALRQNLDSIIDWAISAIQKSPQQHQAIMDKANQMVRTTLGPLAKKLEIDL